MEPQRILTIICRYKEDLSWIKHLKGDVAIYNKGDDFPWDFQRTDVENFGREAETYVKGILDFYDQLANYDRIVFLQGNPFEQSKSILQKLNQSHNESFVCLGDNTQSVKTGINCIYNSSYHIADLFFTEIVKNTPWENEKNNFASENLTKINFSVTERDGTVENRSSELLEIIYLCEIMQIKYKDANYHWDCGAQYSVKVESILNKSYYWWLSLYRLIHYTSKTLNLILIAYILERTWPLIWAHEEIIYPHQAGK
jgi:hypothetical protein